MDAEDPLPIGRRRLRTRAITDVLGRLVGPGENIEAEAKRYNIPAAALRRRVEGRQRDRESRELRTAPVRARLPEGADPWDWPTPETISLETGLPLDVVRSAMNSEAHSRLLPPVWEQCNPIATASARQRR